MARVGKEWSAVSRVFHRPPRPILTELELSRTLDLAVSALGDPEPVTALVRGDRVVPSRQRLDAVAVLTEWETRLSALQRLALVDAVASWLSEPNGGEQLAHALLGAACTTEITAEHAYLALITPPDTAGDQSEGRPGRTPTTWSGSSGPGGSRSSNLGHRACWCAPPPGRPPAAERGPDRRASAAAEDRT